MERTHVTIVIANGRALAPLCENHRLIVDSSTDRASRVSTWISGGVQRPHATVNRSHLPGRRSHRTCPYRARGIVGVVASPGASPLRLDRLLCVFCLRLRRRVMHAACQVQRAPRTEAFSAAWYSFRHLRQLSIREHSLEVMKKAHGEGLIISDQAVVFFLFYSRDYYKLSLCVTFSDTFDNLWKSRRAYTQWRVFYKLLYDQISLDVIFFLIGMLLWLFSSS